MEGGEKREGLGRRQQGVTECEKDEGRGGIGRCVGVGGGGRGRGRGGGKTLTNRFCRRNGVTRGGDARRGWGRLRGGVLLTCSHLRGLEFHPLK